MVQVFKSDVVVCHLLALSHLYACDTLSSALEIRLIYGYCFSTTIYMYNNKDGHTFFCLSQPHPHKGTNKTFG